MQYHKNAGKLGNIKSQITQKSNAVKKRVEYNENPNKCIFCKHSLDYDKRDQKFCSQSCNGNYWAEKKNYRKTIREVCCLSCSKEMHKPSKKFCNLQCHIEYKYKLSIEKILKGDASVDNRRYKKYLINTFGDKCMKCGWAEKNCVTNKVPIELNHIDGNSENKDLKNLELLCPNCHSLTSTYKALNIGNGRHKRRQRYKDGKSY